MPLPASIRLSGASSVERNTVRPVLSASLRKRFVSGMRVCSIGSPMSATTCPYFSYSPLVSRLSTWFQEKVKPLQAARLLAQHHPLQHVEEGERAFQHRLVRTHRGEDVVHLCDRAQDARRVHRARQVEEEQVVTAFRRQASLAMSGACSTRHLRTG